MEINLNISVTMGTNPVKFLYENIRDYVWENDDDEQDLG